MSPFVYVSEPVLNTYPSLMPVEIHSFKLINISIRLVECELERKNWVNIF